MNVSGPDGVGTGTRSDPFQSPSTQYWQPGDEIFLCVIRVRKWLRWLSMFPAQLRLLSGGIHGARAGRNAAASRPASGGKRGDGPPCIQHLQRTQGGGRVFPSRDTRPVFQAVLFARRRGALCRGLGKRTSPQRSKEAQTTDCGRRNRTPSLRSAESGQKRCPLRAVRATSTISVKRSPSTSAAPTFPTNLGSPPTDPSPKITLSSKCGSSARIPTSAVACSRTTATSIPP